MVLGAFFCVNSISAQQQLILDSADHIIWDRKNPLNWNHYRFRALNRQRYAGEMAITSVKISARGFIRKGIPDFQVHVYFVKPDSWTSDTTDLNLLAHERLHFDIGEVYAHKIREKISEMREAGETSPKSYRVAIQNLITEFKVYSGQYDRDTSFGTVISKQKEWEDRINKRIDKILSN